MKIAENSNLEGSLIKKVAAKVLFFIPAILLFFSSVSKAAANMADSSGRVFISTSVSKTTIHAGEAFTVAYRLHFSEAVTDQQTPVELSLKDAYLQEYPDGSAEISKEIINGKHYQVLEIKKLLVVVHHAGSFTIPSINFKVKVNSQSSADDFFGPDKAVVKNISSQPQNINILPLPPVADSLGFTGAVGKFNIATNFVQAETSTNSLKVKIDITGSGSWINAKPTTPKLPIGIDFFAGKNQESHQLTSDGLTTHYTYEFTLTANYKNNYRIGPFLITYYDPSVSKYVQYTSPVYNWKVETGPDLPKQIAHLNHTTASKKADLLYTEVSLNNNVPLFFGSVSFYLLAFLTLTMLVIGAGYHAYQKERSVNRAYHNYRKARRRAVKEIKLLSRNADNTDNDIFSGELMRIFYKYLLNKDIAPAEDKIYGDITAVLIQRQLPQNTIQQTADFVKLQHRSRFSLVAEIYDKGNNSQMLLEIINAIDDNE